MCPCSDITCLFRHIILPQCSKLWFSFCSFESDRLSLFWHVFLSRCDDKTFKRLMSNFGSSRSEETCSAVLELLERVTRLHKQLELKERQAEIDMDQVNRHWLPSHQGGLPQYALTCPACSICIELCSCLALHHKPFCGCVYGVKLD